MAIADRIAGYFGWRRTPTEGAGAFSGATGAATARRDDKREPSYEDVNRAVLHALWPLPRVIPGPWNTASDMKKISRANARCAALRVWVDTAALTRNERKAYLDWIDFCERDNKASEEEINTGQRRKQLDEATTRWRHEHERAIAANITKPPM